MTISALSRLRVEPSDGPARDEWVAEERPVALVVGGISQAVMLSTPADLDDFALGFALTEGWIGQAKDLLDCERHDTAQGIVLELRLCTEWDLRLRARRRSLAGRTACGLCGVDSLDALDRPLPLPVATPTALPDAAALDRAVRALPDAMPLHARCGGMHGAAWCDLDGELLAVREDLGRHNALDKLIGHLARSSLLDKPGWLLMSSRAGYEIVYKAAMVGLVAMASVSAPSTAAVRLARQQGMALWSFVRPGRFNRYA
jgi:formate dehydrogenase accessory protein FdhD